MLFSGKGGVGKTTVAAATGLASARRGSRVLVLSLDLAHSLSDAFGLDRSLFDQGKGRPTPVADNLEIQEIDVQQEVEDRWHDAGNVFSLLLASTGIHDALAEDLVLMPGMEDLITLLYLNQHARDSRYDLIVIDCPPTGDSLRFISMPKTLEWYVRKRFGMTPGGDPKPGSADASGRGLMELYRGLAGVDALLQDSTRTSVRLVTTPERVVLRETQRAFMYFSLYGLVTDRVVANRVFPRSTAMAARNRSQKTLLAEMEDLFAPVPVSRVPFYHDEVIGQASLARMATDLYGTGDPGEPGPSRPSFQLETDGGRPVLSVSIPFTRKSDLTLHREGEHLIVRIGSFKRHIPLPRELLRTQILHAKVESGRLHIEFDRSIPTG
ncbi:MAG: ArsA family ATPase [Opitutaceae bacterium]